MYLSVWLTEQRMVWRTVSVGVTNISITTPTDRDQFRRRHDVMVHKLSFNKTPLRSMENLRQTSSNIKSGHEDVSWW
jgi:hypothetical protein